MFGSKVPFEEAYPTIEEITVEIQEDGYMVKNKQNHKFTKEFLVPTISCNNSSCRQGGISIESEIRDMVRNKQTQLEAYKLCKGHEGSPKGIRRGRNCMNGFEINITIKYKEN